MISKVEISALEILLVTRVNSEGRNWVEDLIARETVRSTDSSTLMPYGYTSLNLDLAPGSWKDEGEAMQYVEADSDLTWTATPT
jgi:hypothetical protein